MGFTKTAGACARATVSKGPVGQSAGRRVGFRNNFAAAALLAGEAEALIHKVIELAPVCNSTAVRLCLKRILPPRRDRMDRFVLPPIESEADIAAAMKAVTSALAGGYLRRARRRR
jgi:hypothetical protein